MCRLLGFVAHPPTTLADVLGSALTDFTELSVQHGDGWGIATASRTGVQVHKAVESARRSAEFAALVSDLVVDTAMVHLRWATLGLATDLANTHPFTDGEVAFCHNGSISPPASLDPLIDPDLLASRQGDTDSERYFLALLTRMRTSGPLDALRDTLADVSRLHHSGLNCMLLTPQALYAVCSYDARADDGAAAGLDLGEGYYRLHYAQRGSATVVASSGWGSGWQEVGNDQVIVVRRDTGQVSVHDLGVARRTA